MTKKNKLNFKLPLIQAPLTGYPKQIELIIPICEQGALGVYSTELQSLEEIENDIRSIQQNTQQPFAVLINLSESEAIIDLADRSATNGYLKSAYQALNLEALEAPEFPDVNTICKTVVKLAPPVLIFQNGLPTDAFIEHCHKRGITMLAFAANTLEAMAIDCTLIDGIILQGSESAGIQSKFENDLDTPRFPINTLIYHIQKHVNKPIIAWGDCQTPQGTAQLMQKGVKAVILDSPFWTVDESPIPESYRQALTTQNEMTVCITDIWQGQPAQVIQNALTKYKIQNNGRTLSTSKQRRLLKPVIDAAIAQNNAEYLPLWAGLCTTYSKTSLSKLCGDYASVLETFITEKAE